MHNTGVYSFLIDVPQNAWAYSFLDNNNYYAATVETPEISEDVFDNAMVKIYRTFNYDKADARQIELPYILPREEYWEYTDPVEDGEKGFWGFFTETVTYEMGIGKIFLFYTRSDFDYELEEYPQAFPPEAMQFRCVITY